MTSPSSSSGTKETSDRTQHPELRVVIKRDTDARAGLYGKDVAFRMILTDGVYAERSPIFCRVATLLLLYKCAYLLAWN
jgi:hypothetical protein